jgi:hypothetical protein
VGAQIMDMYFFDEIHTENSFQLNEWSFFVNHGSKSDLSGCRSNDHILYYNQIGRILYKYYWVCRQ